MFVDISIGKQQILEHSVVFGCEIRLIDTAENQARVQAEASLYTIAHTVP